MRPSRNTAYPFLAKSIISSNLDHSLSIWIKFDLMSNVAGDCGDWELDLSC